VDGVEEGRGEEYASCSKVVREMLLKGHSEKSSDAGRLGQEESDRKNSRRYWGYGSASHGKWKKKEGHIGSPSRWTRISYTTARSSEPALNSRGEEGKILKRSTRKQQRKGVWSQIGARKPRDRRGERWGRTSKR